MIDRFEMTILVISNTLCICVNVIFFFFRILYNKKNYVFLRSFFFFITFTIDDSEEREQKGKRGIESVM